MALSLNQIKKKPVKLFTVNKDEIASTIKNNETVSTISNNETVSTINDNEIAPTIKSDEQMEALEKPSKPWSDVVTNFDPTSQVGFSEQKDQLQNIDNFFESRSNFTNSGSSLGGIGLWCEVLSV